MASLSQRFSSLLRSPRVRSIILLIGGYKVYTYIRTDNVLYKRFNGARHRPGQTVIDLDLDSVRIVSNEGRSAFPTTEEIQLPQLISVLDSAKQDPRVTGLVVRGISGLQSVGLAEISELRNAIRDFSNSWGGKHTMLHVPEGVGSIGNGTVPLYFASAFNSVHVQPTSSVTVPGISLGTLFFKNMLEKLGLKAKKVARKDFKTAANNFTEDKFTEAHRESTETLLEALMNEIVTEVANGRNLSEKQVLDAIDDGLMNVKEAQQSGLIDEALYRDELPKYMRQKLQAGIEARVKVREQAETEWREAMAELTSAWTKPVENNWYNIWESGGFLSNLHNVNFALPCSILFCDDEQDVVEKSIQQEIRALNAHIKWLETCPWEAYADEDQRKNSVYGAIPYISSLLEAEIVVCKNAVKALEGMPKLISSHRDPKDKSTFRWEKDDFDHLVRWSRSVWRAKCMAARIVKTLVSKEDELKRISRGTPEESDELEVLSQVYRPRLFLVGDQNDYEIEGTQESEEDTEEAGDVSNKEEEAEVDDSGDSKTLVAIHKMQQALMDLQAEEDEEKPLEPYEKINLRYVRLNDYIDTLNAEKRATHYKATPLLHFRNSDMIDSSDRNALLHLQRANHRFAPWRLHNSSRGNYIAIIHVNDAISDDSADATRAAIRRADKDPFIKATVLRINSPGGSATASDLISRAVEVAKKPVVASMSSVCASGGYFISAPCDKIFASNSTITGSIGVIFTTFNSSNLFDKVGITTDRCSRGKYADYFGALSTVTEWSEDFEERVNKMIDTFYADFLNVVSKGRKLNLEETERIAQGRVWAGSDAVKLGLVDEVGGLHEAVLAAAELADLTPDMEVTAIDYPTTSMLLQDAARRRGLIPSHLDEEGDEAVSEKKRRRRFWFLSGDSDHGEYEETTKMNIFGGIPSFASFSDDVFARILSQVDLFLASHERSFVKQMMEGMIFKGLNILQSRNTEAIKAELENLKATSGRAAAIAPIIELDE